MKFNIKSAMEYSSKLKNVINDVENSLRVNTSLVNGWGGNNLENKNEVPAANNGVYTATITHKKSTLNSIVDKELNDEVVDVTPINDLAKLSPNRRLELLNDLIVERAKIDYEIETIKNNSKFTDEFTNQEVTYDLGCQINKMYREYNSFVLKPLVEMDTELSMTTEGKISGLVSSEEKAGIVVTYPIEIKVESNVDNKEVLKQYDDINNKCTLNSAKLSEIEISKYFEFEPKFNLNPSIRSLIEAYNEQ